MNIYIYIYIYIDDWDNKSFTLPLLCGGQVKLNRKAKLRVEYRKPNVGKAKAVIKVNKSRKQS